MLGITDTAVFYVEKLYPELHVLLTKRYSQYKAKVVTQYVPLFIKGANRPLIGTAKPAEALRILLQTNGKNVTALKDLWGISTDSLF